MYGIKIVGIILVQNEDLYIERVLSNICNFCDEIIVADHLSKDGTSEIVNGLNLAGCVVHYHSINDPSESHDLISRYAGKPVWIFAVDGDEIYDPVGLRRLKSTIVNGQFDEYWMIFGNVLHCVDFDLSENSARGYLAPPCRSMTKLYNFSAISSWEGPCPERLHGGTIQFNSGFDKSLRLEMHKKHSWEDSEFRCLHLCFIRRSSLEKKQQDEIHVRKNISDKRSEGIVRRIKNKIGGLLGVSSSSEWKKEKYMRGKLVKKDIKVFFS